MKQNIVYFSKAVITLLLLAVIFAAAPLGAFAENITYTGDGQGIKEYLKPPLELDSFYPGDGRADSSGNTVTINYVPGPNMTDLNSAMGGVAWDGYATGNTLIMHNGVVYTVSGGVAGDFGSFATGNRVIVNGGEIKVINGGYAVNEQAAYNTVIINGGTVIESIRGGFSEKNSATYNIVTIGAGAALGNIDLFGGYAYTAGFDAFSGNTLNINGYTTGSGRLDEFTNFEYLNFILPANVQNNDVILSVNTVYLNEHSLTGRDSNISINIMGGGRIQELGDSYKLIDATNWNGGQIAQDGQTLLVAKGLALLYGFEITQNAKDITAVVKSVKANPQGKSLLQARNAAIVNLNRGLDLSSGYGMDSAKASVKKGNRSFFALNGSSVEQETGSSIDLEGASLMAGAAWGGKIRSSEITLGVFVEAGMGSYDSHNSFNGLATLEGSGDTHYFGGGVLASFEATSGFDPIRGFHADASIRGGYVESDYKSYVTNLSQKADFDTKGYYLGAHLGAGYAFRITKKSTLDAYAKYLWAHIASDDASILGDKFKFDSADSHRVRGGLRYSHSFGAIKPYLGAAYEYELDGEAGGSVWSYDMAKTDMGGGTVMGELGFAYTTASALSVSLAAEAYGGKREGFGGSFKLLYRF